MRKVQPCWQAPILLALFLLTSCRFLTSTEPETTTYHSGVSEVRLRFIATDENAHTVNNLTVDDLVVVDDQVVVREFSSFQISRIAALQLVVLIDSSESVGSVFQGQMSALTHLVSQAAWIPDENLSMQSFRNTESKMVCSGDCRRAPLPVLLSGTRAAGATPLFDAIVIASASLSNHPPGLQPIILLFSDGEDTISIHSFPEAIEAALASDVEIYAVDANRDSHSDGAGGLRRLADATGGVYFPFGVNPSAIDYALQQNLQSAYTLTYKPTTTSAGFHSVRIMPTHNLNLHFRCRRNYYQDSIN